MAIIARFTMDIIADKRFELYQHAKKNPNPLHSMGFPKPQVLISGIGNAESYIEMNYRFESLEALGVVWARMYDAPPRMWRRSLAPYTVAGSARWQVLTIKEDDDET